MGCFELNFEIHILGMWKTHINLLREGIIYSFYVT